MDVVPPPLQVEVIEAVQSEGVVKVYASESSSPAIKSTWSLKFKGRWSMLPRGYDPVPVSKRGCNRPIEQTDFKLAVAGERSRVEQTGSISRLKRNENWMPSENGSCLEIKERHPNLLLPQLRLAELVRLLKPVREG